MPQDSDGKVRLAKSNSHLSVVLAINLYLPRYDVKPTGNKRIRLELVRWWCSVEAWLAMPSRYLMQNKGLPTNGYQNHLIIQFLPRKQVRYLDLC
ncbi:MAG: hypothetical protein CL912_06815 [Deltaproteobacteria bacterium]|nr:hypothetical protein [Deltaproteobacteria bacterium]